MNLDPIANANAGTNTLVEATGRLAAAMAEAWPRAQAHWSSFLLLSDPIDDSEQPSVAQIHLGNRQVSVNFKALLEKDLQGCIEAILAHEVGHHVKYPGSLAVHARMRIIEQALLPFEEFSVTNLFTDLMINERLGRKLQDQLATVYRAYSSDPAFHGSDRWKQDPSFLFYLSIYEELWQLPRADLMGPLEEQFHEHFPQYRVESIVLAQDLFAMEPNVYTQFLYFLSIISHYIEPIDSEPAASSPYACSCDAPSPDDWADALSPTAQERAAIERAIRNGWFHKAEEDILKQLEDVEERIGRLPGAGTRDAQLIPEIMAAWYRQQAESHLIQPPPQRRLGEAIVPTTLEDWEPGDSPRNIDWLSTILARGDQLGVGMPMQRTRIAEEEGQETELWQPRIEIYLDVSGSMPDPRVQINAMTLAAQILTLGTVRTRGWVRALVYSNEPVLYWEWCRSEIEISKFLMHYVGGGTQFPFGILQHSLDECRDDPPIRVVISDCDFVRNYVDLLEAKPDHKILSDAVRQSANFVLLQHLADPEWMRTFRDLGMTVVDVPEMEDFPRIATDLARALFPEDGHGPVSTKNQH